MRPKLLLLDEPCKKAREIMESVCECMTMYSNYVADLVYTQLTPYKPNEFNVNVPVFSPCTGVDHIQAPKVIHLDDEWKQTEGQYITSTAEHTWSLILQLAKLNRMQLSGKTLGIIGYGRIGQQVLKHARAFGMRIAIQEKPVRGLTTALEVVLDEQNKEMFYRLCDIITIHVPLNDETRGMIGNKQFEMMKPGALLVNTSRAEIVNEKSVLHYLNFGTLGGYANDFNQCSHHPKVIATSHIGGNCIEAREATDIYIANKIVEYVKERYQ